MSRIEEKDPILAEEIRKLMFVFEDIIKIDDKGIQTLLKEVPNDKLLLAAQNRERGDSSQDLQEHLAAGGEASQEDLQNMGPARLTTSRRRR